MEQDDTNRPRLIGFCSVLAVTVPTLLSAATARAEPPPAPCHPNPTADADEAAFRGRGDVVNLPGELRDRLAQLANRPHTYLPLRVFNEADGNSQLFQYYLLDTTGFELNVFTAIIPGVNDGNVQLTVTGGNCGLPTVGAVRLVLEPKPGLPTDPNNPRAFNDVFTDISPLFVINNESGWYEGWMIHDITVAQIAAPRPDGHAQFGTITQQGAAILARMGTGNNVPGNIFTIDGRPPHFPSAKRRVSAGEHGRVQRLPAGGCPFLLGGQLPGHELDPTRFMNFRLPAGSPTISENPPDAFEDGEIGKLQSIVAGSGPSGVNNQPQAVGDNPNLPRDPDKFECRCRCAKRISPARGSKRAR